MSAVEVSVEYKSQGRNKQLARPVDANSLEDLLEALDWTKSRVNEYLTTVVEEEKAASSKAVARGGPASSQEADSESREEGDRKRLRGEED